MTELLFIRILNMSLTGSLVILSVLVMRILLRKAPSIFSYCLWAVVLFRLLCTISFTATFSPLNALQAPVTNHGRIEYIPEELLYHSQSPAQTIMPINGITDTVPQGITNTMQAGALNTTGLILKIASGVWLAGILIMASYSIITLIHLAGKLKTASWERDNIYITDAISTPFVIGLIHPRIYLPSILGEKERQYILLHEQVHLKRKDHLIKIISYATLCLHWFNPLVWAAFFLSGKDMEMSCDEAVIRKIGSHVKKDYSTSLLCLSTGKRIVNGIPLAFGEGDTGSRIKNVLRYRKPAAFTIGIAAAACIVVTIVLLANPGKSGNNTENGGLLTDYGVIMEVELDGVTRQMFISPLHGTVEIPEAKTIDTWFEPGDERDPHRLLPGDLAAITFSSEDEIAIQETWPARFSGPAESISILWQGLSLQDIGDGSRLLGSTYLLTFPGGVVPEVSTAKVGDILSLYWEETEDEAYLTQVPESSQSRLIVSTPILAITENEYGGRMLTVGLNTFAVSQMLGGFGFHTRFALNSGDNLTTKEDLRAIEEAQAYLNDQSRQEQDTSTDSVTPLADFCTVYIRSIARSARAIDSYLPGDDFPYNSEEPLAFAEDCVFKVNYSMDNMDYREVSFDTFAGLIESAPHALNKPCILVFKDDLIIEATLQSVFFHYGIGVDMFTPDESIYAYLLEKEGEDAFETCYSLTSTESMDISDGEGIETIEVCTGNIGDGDSGIVMFKNTAGELLCIQDAHTARVGWNNIYLGEKDGVPFIMNVYVEDRWNYGGYGYWVYRLDEKGSIKQIAGSRFDFELGSDLLYYDDDLFKQWIDGMTAWLENSHLILSSQDGEIRTEKVSDADRYNYDTLNLKGRE